MTPVVAFYNPASSRNHEGMGTTTLLYHVAWMLRELGVNVVAVDLDPQTHLTSAFVDDEVVESLWEGDERQSVYGAVAPLLQGGDMANPYVHELEMGLWLVPGDLRLSETEEPLSRAWSDAGDGDQRAFEALSAFGSLAQHAAEANQADLVLLDIGPDLTALNRAALAAADHVVVPVAPDPYSLQGLVSLGPALGHWRREWADRKQRAGGVWVPEGAMHLAGYVVLQHGIRADRVVGDYDRLLRRVPAAYQSAMLEGSDAAGDIWPVTDDPHCLGVIRHYHGLAPMARDARRPVFLLRMADGAMGAHQQAVLASRRHYADLTRSILDAVGVGELVA